MIRYDPSMIPHLDPTTLPGPAQKIVSDGAPQKLQLMAARGIVPGLRPDAVVSVLVILAQHADGGIANQAQQTLDQLPEPLLLGALDADLPEAVIFVFAQKFTNRMDVLEKLIRMPRLPIAAVSHLASKGGEATTELVATNEERMLANPELIEAIYMNPSSRMSTSNRLVELAVRHQIELKGIPAWKEITQAIRGELISEPTEEPLPEDQLFWEQHDLAEQLTDDGLEDAYFEDEEGQEHLEDKFKPLYQKLADMTVAEKVRRAMLGTKEERMMLIREQNKVISSAAARSPLLQEPDVAQISKSRGVPEDVLRIIGTTAEWLKSYQIKKNLVENAKTPIAIANKLVLHLREADLRKLAKNKNIQGAVRTQVRRHLERRRN